MLIVNFLYALLDEPCFFSLAQRLVSADYRSIRQVIRQELGPVTGQWVIDLGCGTGNLADEFGGACYVGVDLDLAYVRFARRTTRGQFAVMDMTELALRDDAFDAALAVGLTHHLDDRSAKQLACEIRRVCRDRALVLIVDIVLPHRWNLLERARQRWAERGRFLRPSEVYQALLAASGLTVKEAYRIRSGFLEYQVLVMRVRKKLGVTNECQTKGCPALKGGFAG